MILLNLFIFLVLFSCIRCNAYDEKLVLSLMRKNLFGNEAEIIHKNKLSNILRYTGSKDNQKILQHEGIVYAIPNPSELNAYLKERETYTFSNKALGVGMVRGKEKAEQWMKNRRKGFVIPEDHPRHNTTNCVHLSRQSGQRPVSMYTEWKHTIEPFYMYKLHNGIIDHTGMVALEDGYVQFLSQCETIMPLKGKSFDRSIREALTELDKSFPADSNNRWGKIFTDYKYNHKQEELLPALKEPIVNKVFVISAIWDYNYHHFIHDSVARLIRFLPFLLENKDIFIHVREMEKKNNKMKKRTKGMPLREKIFRLLGLDPNRIIARSVRAREIYLPREIACNYALKHALELRLLADVFLDRAKLYSNGACKSSLNDKTMRVIVMERDCHPFLRIWRCLNGTDLTHIHTMAHRYLPEHEVYSTGQFPHKNDADLTMALACDILEYSKANIIMGKHGAGFTNMLFMKPSGVVIELVGEFDGRMLPLCGYHGPLASIFGLHHYIYYYDFFAGTDVNFTETMTQASTFYFFSKLLFLPDKGRVFDFSNSVLKALPLGSFNQSFMLNH